MNTICEGFCLARAASRLQGPAVTLPAEHNNKTDSCNANSGNMSFSQTRCVA